MPLGVLPAVLPVCLPTLHGIQARRAAAVEAIDPADLELFKVRLTLPPSPPARGRRTATGADDPRRN
jgi:hypothetical protein